MEKTKKQNYQENGPRRIINLNRAAAENMGIQWHDTVNGIELHVPINPISPKVFEGLRESGFNNFECEEVAMAVESISMKRVLVEITERSKY